MPYRQSDPWPVLDRSVKQLARLVEVSAGVEHAIDLGPVAGPFLDLVEVAHVGDCAGSGEPNWLDFGFAASRLPMKRVTVGSLTATAGAITN